VQVLIECVKFFSTWLGCLSSEISSAGVRAVWKWWGLSVKFLELFTDASWKVKTNQAISSCIYFNLSIILAIVFIEVVSNLKTCKVFILFEIWKFYFTSRYPFVVSHNLIDAKKLLSWVLRPEGYWVLILTLDEITASFNLFTRL